MAFIGLTKVLCLYLCVGSQKSLSWYPNKIIPIKFIAPKEELTFIVSNARPHPVDYIFCLTVYSPSWSLNSSNYLLYLKIFMLGLHSLLERFLILLARSEWPSVATWSVYCFYSPFDINELNAWVFYLYGDDVLLPSLDVIWALDLEMLTDKSSTRIGYLKYSDALLPLSIPSKESVILFYLSTTIYFSSVI